MSKLVKNMLVDDLKTRLAGGGDLIVVSLGKLDAIQTSQLRQTLRKKNIHLQMVKNSLARRATLDTPLAPAFERRSSIASRVSKTSRASSSAAAPSTDRGSRPAT